MPRFFFHTAIDDREQPDTQGVELESISAARNEAMRHAGEFLVDRAKDDCPAALWQLRVEDDRALLLYQLDFVMTSSSAVRSDH